MFPCRALFWQEAHPLQFESREDEQHFPMVVVGRRPDPYIRFLTNSPSLAVHHPKQLYQRTGFRYSHRLRARPTLFQISRMVGGRKGPDCWDNLIRWCWSRKDGRVTQADRGQPAGEQKGDLFVFYSEQFQLILGEKQDEQYNVGQFSPRTACIWGFSRSGFQSGMNSWWVDPWVWCSI